MRLDKIEGRPDNVCALFGLFLFVIYNNSEYHLGKVKENNLCQIKLILGPSIKLLVNNNYDDGFEQNIDGENIDPNEVCFYPFRDANGDCL